MQRKRRSPYLHSRRAAPGDRLRRKLILALALSIVFLVLTLVRFDQDFAAVEPDISDQARAATGQLEEWADGFESLMSEKYFSQKWIRDFETPDGNNSDSQGSISFSLKYPARYRIHDFISGIIQISESKGFEIIESYETLNPRGFGLFLSSKQGEVIQLKFREDPELEWLSGRIAVVIDDFGYRIDEAAQTLLSSNLIFTAAVIPGTQYAEQVARTAKKAGIDVIIHLPMEPLLREVEKDGYTVFVGMSQKEIDAVVERALKAVPGAIGVNNHMGSKATTDRTTMARLMQSLQNHNLLFVDSITSRSSVAYQEAERKGVAALKLTTFLDNSENPASLAEVLSHTVNRLPELDHAVLIGHARIETSKILPAEMQKWSAKGISFVGVGDLLESQ